VYVALSGDHQRCRSVSYYLVLFRVELDGGSVRQDGVVADDVGLHGGVPLGAAARSSGKAPLS
jgi:hypothetical protein